MTKDYKSNSEKSKPDENFLGRIYGYGIVFMIGFVIGLWNPFQHMNKSEKASTTMENQTLSEKPTESTEETTPLAPKFDFYQLLPEMEVEIVDHVGHDAVIEENLTATPRDLQAEEQKSVVSDKEQSKNFGPPYRLQAGSFKSSEEAERMKVELAFLGVSSSIEKLKTENGVLHQVNLGPYSTVQDADKVGAALLKHGFVAVRVLKEN